MPYTNPASLVSTTWLAEHLEDPDVKVLDCSWHLPDSERDAFFEYELRHIPGACFFDVDAIADLDTELPHMLPSPEAFAEAVGAMGISNDSHVIVYDGAGGPLAAARVWWMFRVFGHDRVSMLDGGLPRWGKEKNEMEDGPPEKCGKAVFQAHFRSRMVRSMGDLLDNLETEREIVLDARSDGRFNGVDPEPRPSKHQGHIPKSINVPFADLMIPRRDYMMQPAEEIREVFTDEGIDFTKPLVISCGSGVTACVNAFALHLIGFEDVAVYDGSWTEWGNRDDTPIER